MKNFNYEEAKNRTKLGMTLFFASLILAGIINNVVAWTIWFAVAGTLAVGVIVGKINK